MRTTETWRGGYLVERTVDNGDGTGTRTWFHEDGEVRVVDPLDGLPVIEASQPEPVADDLVQVLATVTEPLGRLSGNATSATVRNAVIEMKRLVDEIHAQVEV